MNLFRQAISRLPQFAESRAYRRPRSKSLHGDLLESRIYLASIVSDGFDSPGLDTNVWQFVDPQGDSSVAVSGGQVEISVAGGTEHDVWSSGNNAARIMQDVDDTDFLAEFKVDSVPDTTAQMAGILVEAGPGEFLRFDFVHLSSGLHIFAASFAGGQPTVQHSAPVTAGDSMHLRVQRIGDQWNQEYSYDGQTWIAAAAFSYALVVDEVGIFAGNAISNPQYTAEFDYFLAAAPPALAVRIDSLVTNDTTPGLAGTIGDPLATIQVTVNGQQIAAINNGDGTWEVPDNTLASLGEGAYNVEAVAQALTGETAQDATSGELVIDLTPPVVTVDPLATAASRPTLSGTVSDPGLPVQVTVNGSVYTALTQGNTWLLDGQSLVAPLVDGTYDVIAQATDAAGNDSFDTSTDELLIDSSIPLVTVNASVTNDARPPLSGTINDPAATIDVTVAGIVYSAQNLGDGTWLLPDDTIQNALAEGVYNVVVQATGAGGVGLDSTLDELTIDLTSPQVTFATLLTESSSPALTGTVDDLQASVAVTVDGATYAALNLGGGSWSLAAGTIAPLALGSYPLIVTATDAAGNQGTSDSAALHIVQDSEAPFVDLWYGDVQSFGNLGNPQPWVNILGNVMDEDGLSSLTYSVNGGAAESLNIGPDGRRLQYAGDFNADIHESELVTGPNTVTITATDTIGNQTVKTVTVDYAISAPIPDVLTIDWETATRIDEVGQVVDGKWHLTPDGVRTTDIGYDRLIAVGDLSMEDFEAEVEFTIHSWDQSAPWGPLVGLGVRWQGHANLDASQPHWQYWPLPAFATYGYNKSAQQTELVLQGFDDRSPNWFKSLPITSLTQGIPYVMKVRVVSDSGAEPLYSMKVWEQGTPEPAVWALSRTGTITDPVSGSLLLAAHYSDVTFGDVIIRQIADETAPTLSGVQATPTASTISVSGSTDEAATLTVLYGLTDQFELGSVTTSTLSTTHQALIDGLDPETDYYLRTLATDAAGNQSVAQDLVVRTDVADVTAPTISNLSLLTLSEQIRVQADTDELATLEVSYGLTNSYELGTLTGGLAVTGHELMLTGLQSSTTYYLRIVATDPSGNVSSEQTFVETTQPPDVDPPVIQSVLSTPGITTIDLSVQLSEYGQIEVSYGLTASYELGSVQGPPLETNHDVTLSGLTADTTYYVRVVAIDPSGNVSAPQDLVLTTEQLLLPVSDHFNGPLDTNLWTLVDPLSDATLESTGNHVRLGVPGGVVHDMWTSGVNAARLMQTVSDVDFEVEVSFQTPPSGSIGINGLFVDAGAGDFLRFDFYNIGGSIKIFAASFVAGQPTAHVNNAISAQPDQPLLMRVRREGDAWTQFYSTDGQAWTTAVQFVHQAAVQGVGVSSGNAGGSPPAHTAVVDYFFNTASPATDTAAPVIESVDVTENVDGFDIGVNTDEYSTIEVFYGETTAYELGSVALTEPATVHNLTITGLAEGSNYFLRITVTDAAGHQTTQDLPATTAVPDVTPPEVSPVTVAALYDSLRLTFTSNESATSEVQYGLTPSYELGSVPGPLGTNHDVTLSGLTADTAYYVRVVATDPSGNVSVPQDLVLTTEQLLLPVSDHFNGPLDTNLWTLVDPLGDATLASTGNHVQLGIPGGTSHDIWNGNVDAPRLMQTVSDVDFEVDVGFLVPPSESITISGLFVDAGAGNYLRFDFYNNGGNVYVFAASFVADQPTIRTNSTINVPQNQPLLMRVGRVGDVWTQSYSSDGQNWTTATQFVHALNVEGVGITSGNAGGSPPAHTAVVDYFFNTASPATDTAAPAVSGVSSSADETSITVTGTTDENSVWEVQYGLTLNYELGTVSESVPGTGHAVSITGLDSDQTYYVRIVAVDSQGNTSNPIDLEVTTQAPIPSAFESDEFNSGTLDTSVWTLVDPTGDGSIDVSGGAANLSVAGGSDHDIWSSGINAPRLMQAAGDVDFSAEVKFDNLPTGQYAMTGILVEGSANTFLRFDFYSDGSNIHVFAARIQGGTATALYNTVIAPTGSSLYMRVTRNGDAWTQEYSDDGGNWQSAATFVTALQVLGIGFYAGNVGGSTAPAYASSVDYFRLV